LYFFLGISILLDVKRHSSSQTTFLGVHQYPLRRIGGGKRITLTHAGEKFLNEWMEKNAFVAWTIDPKPWIIEPKLLLELSCPLNIRDNEHHPFALDLKKMRTEALQRAREMPIANEHSKKR